MIRQQPACSITYRNRAQDKIDKLWPGGFVGAVESYIRGDILFSDITKQTGVHFRAIRKLMISAGVQIRSRSESQKIDYARNPGRKAKVAAANKLHRAFCRPDVRARMIASRKAAHLVNPLLHVNSLAKPSVNEILVLDALRDAGIECVFNKPSPPYWLDIYIPEIKLGIELQRPDWPCKVRHFSIIESLGLNALIYFANYQIKQGRICDLVKFVSDVKARRCDPSVLGEHAMLSRKPHGPYICLNEHKFRWAFGRVASKHGSPVA